MKDAPDKDPVRCGAMARVFGLSALVLLSALGASARANAANIPCATDEVGTVTLDGLADDWIDVKGAETGGEGEQLALRCSVEGGTLNLVIQASDARIVRTKQGRAGEDQLTLSVGRKRYVIFPASETVKAKLAPGGGKLASTFSAKGFIVELAIPLASLGQGKHPERLTYALKFEDCDSAVALKAERTVTLEGELAFTAGDSVLDGFLGERHLSRGTVRFQGSVRAGKEAVQLVLAGKYLAAITGDSYGYVEIPVADGKDIQKPALVDLAGDGRQAFLVRYTERGEGGAREVLAAFRPDRAGVKRVFAVELGKQLAGGRLTTKLTMKPRGKATDLVIDVAPADGLTAERYTEAAATDMEPILLPWSGPKRVTFSFSGDQYQKR